jgi:predicted alpha/beta-hydrolase family hydrolase
MPYLIDGPADAGTHLILAHGAGEGPDSPFMTRVAQTLAAGGVRVTRFAFPYMAAMAGGAPRRPPDRTAVLLAAWRRVIAAARANGPKRLAIGGKSLGGRMASLIADEEGVAGLVCLGYPFHPPGRLEVLRTDHLAGIRTPTLICQGTRDPFGRPDEVAGYSFSPTVRLAWIPGGEHGFRPDKASGRTWEANLNQAAAEVQAFLAMPRPGA